MDKQGFHRWAWLVVLLLGGVVMLFGGTQDLALYFSSVVMWDSSWYPVPSLVGRSNLLRHY